MFLRSYDSSGTVLRTCNTTNNTTHSTVRQATSESATGVARRSAHVGGSKIQIQIQISGYLSVSVSGSKG